MPLYTLPGAGVAPIVRFIDNAQGPLVINNYYLSSRPILNAIRSKVRGGERVWIILEPRPYRMSRSMVSREFADAKATGAYVVAAPSRFATGRVFDHAKYAVASNEVLIGTANWDYSAFHHNREYIYITHKPRLIQAIQRVAQADVERKPAGAAAASDPQIILSPEPSAERRLAGLLRSSSHVSIEAEEIQPTNPLLRIVERHGSYARVILPSRVNYREEQAVAAMKQAGVSVCLLKSPYMHAKMIVAGGAVPRGGAFAASHGATGIRRYPLGSVYVGSQNFSTTSLTENREVGVILDSPDAHDVALRQFNADWHACVTGRGAESYGGAGGYGGGNYKRSGDWYRKDIPSPGRAIGDEITSKVYGFLRHER